MAAYIETMNPKTGGPGLVGPYSHFHAQQIKDKSEDPNAEIWVFATRNLAKATRMWKAKKYEDGKVSQAFSRVGHKFIQEE